MSVGIPAVNRASEIAKIGDHRQLFVDDALIERMEGARLRLHEPTPGGVAIRIDKPWEGYASGAQVVIEHDGRYLLYYRAMNLDLRPDDRSSTMCVAVSHDGVHWTKPALGLVEYEGRNDTNIVADEQGKAFMATPWVDTRPGVAENQRIKAMASEPISGEQHTAFKDPKGPKRLVFWGSADGFTFRKLDPQPSLVSDLPNCFDGGNSIFWSEAEQQYVLYYRWSDGHRTVARTTSRDLLQWTESLPMIYGDTPREHLYRTNTQPYHRAPHIYIGPAARFMQGRRALTPEQVKALGLKTAHGHVYDNDCSDAVLLTTRAGSTRYDRTFMGAMVRPRIGAENWISRANFPLAGVFPDGEHQLMFWVNRHYMQNTWHIERLLLRVDGFASVTAPYAGGTLVTKPFDFSGAMLDINYRTSAAGSVLVEIQDDQGRAIPGYALSDCHEIFGDEITRIVAWKNGSDVQHLVGRTIRLRFVLKDADLFSFRFQ